MAGWAKRIAGLAAVPALLALSWSYLIQQDVLGIRQSIETLFSYSAPYSCAAHNYTTQIVSIDPLVIYIHGFLNPADIDALLASSEDSFKPSVVTKYGRTAPNPDRTSHSASLPGTNEAVQCVLGRAREFSGALLDSDRDEMGLPQLVRYTRGQKFNLHYDWYPVPQKQQRQGEKAPRMWNRIGSFFAILEDDCDEGETWFPHITPVTEGSDGGPWRKHPDGGLAFKPIKGNSLFWVNLHANGTGDSRVRHAGLPVTAGRKTAMNIWPRRYFD